MSDTIELPGDPPLTVALRRSAQARRLSLRVSRLDGRATLSMPRRASRRAAESFVRDKAGWLRQMVSEAQPAQLVAPGVVLPLEGHGRLLVAGTGRRVLVEPDRIVLPAGEGAGAALAGVLKTLARDRLAAATAHYGDLLGRGYGRITLRDTRSRWGSCSSEGNLMYSWRLILAPPEVLAYVAAHEVAHLERMDHSPAFWAVVARLMPGYETPRRWLREEGARLHAWRFALTR